MTPPPAAAPPPKDDDDWIFDPSLSAVSRSIERELREEAREVESIVAQTELRQRTFADVAREARNRGDLVAIGTERRAFSGRVLYAAGDFITLRTDAVEADINLLAISYLRVVQRGTQRGGIPAGQGPGTFEMRMMERQSPIDQVELGYRSLSETVTGRIMAVGHDHVTMMSDQRDEWTIPLHAIAWVVRRQRHR